MTYYYVKGYAFTHYGKALHFARQIGSKVQVKKTYNPFKILKAFI